MALGHLHAIHDCHATRTKKERINGKKGGQWVVKLYP